MTGETTKRRLDLALVSWIHDVRDGVILHGMSQAKAQRQDRDLVLFVVVVGEPDLSVEDGEQMLGFLALRSGIGTVALEAQRIALGSQEMVVVAAVGRVTGGAALNKGRLMMRGLFAQFVDVAVASKADADGIGLRQAGLLAGVRAVAVCAIAHCAGMRDLCAVDLLGFVVMAGEADSLGVGLGQHNFSIFCRSMAGFAGFGLEWHMLEFRHQLGRCRLVWIVAFHAVGCGEGLVLMSLLQVVILRIMAIETERGGGLG